ncbi:MAG: hypothetical protein L3J56_03130 [Bacteroidales bacterium]|nr:hypothetical protein [Bacteroidales bacterium]
MKKNILKYILLLISVLFFKFNISAQLDSVLNQCNTYLTNDYISDGQQYLSLITGDQTAEFSAVFYGGNTYRIISCGGSGTSDIEFTVYDKYRNKLFSNSDYNYINYWNFQFESTVECFIEAKFAPGTNTSGFIVILIGLQK